MGDFFVINVYCGIGIPAVASPITLSIKTSAFSLASLIAANTAADTASAPYDKTDG